MITQTKVMVAGAGVLVCVGVLLGYCWLKEHDANLAAIAQVKAADAVKVEKDKAISDRDALLRQYQASIAKQQSAVKTSADAVRVIDHYVPAASPAVVVQKADLAPKVQQELPDAPSYTVATQQQSIATAKQLLQCDADRKSLTTCHADLIDTQAKLAVSEQAEASLKAAAQGGTKWQRFGSAVKYIGIGAVVGAAVGYATHK